MDIKKVRRKFNKDLLDKIILETGATLTGEYINLSGSSTIKFICKCGDEGQKVFEKCVIGCGALCKKCTRKVAKDNFIKTNLERYGVEYPSQNAEIKNKIIATNLETYKNNDIVSKIKKTNLEKYGTEHGFQNEDVKAKIKATNMEKYGTEYASQNKDVREKTQATLIEKFGKNPFQNESIRKKKKATNMEKYGVEYALQNKDIKDKCITTNLEKYGVEHPMKNTKVYNKIKATMLEKYGSEHASQNDIIKKKIKATNLERFGSECALSNTVVRSKIKKTNLERYGVEIATQNKDVTAKMMETTLSKFGTTCSLHNETVKAKKIANNILKYGVEHPSQSSQIMEKIQKSAKKYKAYTMPSGEIRQVQGYEPFALDEIVKIYPEDQIKTERADVPRIKYEANSKTHYYFPDIYIPIENKIIEVKATWTYKCKADNIKEKSDATKLLGYKYEIWIYDGKGQKQLES